MRAGAGVDWEDTRAWLAASPGRAALGARLMATADRLAPHLLGAGTAPRAWRPFGLVVVRRRLRDARGLSDRWSGTVLVDASEHPRQQRFTVAHELAHLLLADVDRKQLGLRHDDEERICDEFALRLLVPPGDLRDRLDGQRVKLGDVLALSRRYDVGLSTMLRVLAPTLADTRQLVLVASRRGHPQRPGEIELRAHAVRCGDVFIPGHVRLATLGLEDVVRLSRAERTAAGTSAAVRLKLWRPGESRRSGYATGPAAWSLLRVREGLVLVGLETGELRYSWASPAARAVTAPAA